MKNKQHTPALLKFYGNLKYFLHTIYWIGILYIVSIYIPYILTNVLNIDKNIIWYVYSIFLALYVTLFFITAIALQRNSALFSGKNLSFNFFKIFLALVIGLLLLGSEHFMKVIKLLSLYNGLQIGVVVIAISLIALLIEKKFYNRIATRIFTNTSKLTSIPEFPTDIEPKQRDMLNFLQEQVKEQYQSFVRPIEIKTRYKTGFATTTVQFAYKHRFLGMETFNELFKLVIVEEL